MSPVRRPSEYVERESLGNGVTLSRRKHAFVEVEAFGEGWQVWIPPLAPRVVTLEMRGTCYPLGADEALEIAEALRAGAAALTKS